MNESISKSNEKIQGFFEERKNEKCSFFKKTPINPFLKE